MTLSPIAETIIRKRYLIKDASGTPMERPEDMFRRVATTIAEIGLKYGETEDDVKLDARIFFDMMWNGLFVPNSPTLMNAGRPLGQLSACFVLPVEDDMTSIYDTLKHQALIHQSGGGTGFSFSRLRPKGDLVNSTSGVASGPVSFMDVYNHSTEAIKQGGTRRGANMGILRIDHPDILEFILCKQDTSKITNFNISVAVTDYFLDCLKTNQPYELMNPRTGKQFVPQQDMLHPLDGRLLNKAGAGAFLNSRMVWDLIIECAHRTGEPGLFFIDRANMFNPVPHIGQYEATNPCFVAGTLVATVDGPVPIERLVGTEPLVWSHRGGETILAKMTNVRLTRKNARVIRVCYNKKSPGGRRRYDDFGEVVCTPDHKFLLRDGMWKRAGDLEAGDRLYPFSAKRSMRGDVTIRNGLGSWKAIHSYIAESKHGRHLRDNEVVHHIDGDHQNNHPSNLRILRDTDHKKYHARGEMNSQYKDIDPSRLLQEGVELSNKLGRPITMSDWRRNSSYGRRSISRMFGSERSFIEAVNANHIVVSVQEAGYADVYDGEVPGSNSFMVCDATPYKSHEVSGFVVHNCGEQPLLPYDVCNLGSINLGKFVLPAEPGVMPAVNWSALRDSIHMAVKFLDNVIDANRFPMPEITELSQRIRRIGLGVMGWADMLIKMGIPYNSFEAIKFAREVMKYVDSEAHMASEKLAKQRGNFPEWADSMWGPKGTRHPYTGVRIRQEQPQRNCNVTTVAPTGTISIMAGCSSGIEPIFAVAFWRNQAGEKMLDVSQEFVNHLVQAGVAHERLDGILQKVADTGHIHHAEIPEEVQRVWVTAHDIAPEWHVRMQAAFQEFCDSAISKTINLPHEATVEDVAAAYDLAITLGCKGITVYRDGSRNEQVLSTGKQDKVDTSTPGMTLLPEVGDEVIAHIQQELIDLIWAQHPMQPREIPRDGLPAFSFPVQTPIGKARIFVTEQDGRPFEVFMNIGKSGSDVVAFTEAIGRLISLALRVGIPVDLVAGQLMGIGGAKFIGFGKNRVKSVPDAIGQFLWNRYVQPEITREDREWLDAPLDTPPAKAQGDICPECHSASLMNEEGCRKCHNCGYAEC